MNLPDYMPVLSSGAHDSPKHGACVMEYVSVLAGEPWTDRPACTHPVFATLAIGVNDSLDDSSRQKLVPLIPRLIGTATDDPHVNIAIAVYLLRKTWGVVWPAWAAELLPAWDVLDRWARRDESVTVDDLCAATATAAAAAAAVAAAASAAAATTAAATAATTAVASATAATTAAAVAVATHWTPTGLRYLDLHAVLTGALDVFDELTGRVRSDLAETQWRTLASVVAV